MYDQSISCEYIVCEESLVILMDIESESNEVLRQRLRYNSDMRATRKSHWKRRSGTSYMTIYAAGMCVK